MSASPFDESLNPSKLTPEALAAQIRGWVARTVQDEEVLAAVSGGVDSAVATLIASQALGNRVHPLLLDTGFLRQDEPVLVEKLFNSASCVPLRVLRVEQRFFEATQNLEDAEAKRVAFRETFYSVLKEQAEETGSKWLLQGTIAPDWIETAGGIKTQHNVLTQIGVRSEEKYGFKLLEPLAQLYKDQVRALAQHLGLPEEFVRRQPFPGPGLLVRVPGKVSKRKLELLRRVTALVEQRLSVFEPSQWFAAVFDAPQRLASEVVTGSVNWEFKQRVTGVRGDARVYGSLLSVGPASDAPIKRFDQEVYSLYQNQRTALRELSNSKTRFSRLCIRFAAKKDSSTGYSLVIRAVKTSDYMTADVLKPPYAELKYLAEELLEADESVVDVHYDVTPKPPATIEYE
jgi:GMP synthase (glutamine-hydrolysing)